MDVAAPSRRYLEYGQLHYARQTHANKTNGWEILISLPIVQASFRSFSVKQLQRCPTSDYTDEIRQNDEARIIRVVHIDILRGHHDGN